MARFRTSARTAWRWILVLALSMAVVGLVQSLHPTAAHADIDGYPWAAAKCIDGTTCHWTFNWGYPLVKGQCPAVDTSCLRYPYPNRVKPTAGMGDPWGYSVRNCTSYVAWELRQALGINIGDWGNAAQWSDYSANTPSHPPVGSVHRAAGYTPVVGDIAQWGPEVASGAGHVAYVYAVHNGVASLAEYNAVGTGLFTHNRTTAAGSAGRPDYYIHLGMTKVVTTPPASSYAGDIVQWNGDTKAQKTAWLVSDDLKRYWIPDSSTFNCLWSRGFAFAGPISATLLNQLPDQTGHWAACGSNTLGTNQFLFRGSSLISSNGQYHLELQTSDGKLVLYGPNRAARWSNGTSSDYLVLQPDGNLATFSYKGGETWASNTGNTGANHLVVGNDGTLGLYAPGSILKWSSLFAGSSGGSTATPTTAPARQPTATSTSKSAAPTPTATPAPPPGLGTTPGIARQHGTQWEWLLRNSTSGGTASYDFVYGGYYSTDIPIAGDWDGNGTVTPGIVRQHGTQWEWLLSNSLTGGVANYDFLYGTVEPGDVPIVGDWDGNGTTTIGIARPHGTQWEWLLRNSNSGGVATYDFIYAEYTPTDRPVVGDWDGNGTTTVGIARQNGTHWEWLLRNANNGGVATYDFEYGGYYSTDVPIVGDWDGNRTVTIGIARPHGTQWEWLLRNANSGGIATYDFTYAGYTSTDRPVVGNWDGKS